jgi:hypothetical protein
MSQEPRDVKTRITVEVYSDDYDALRLAAAAGGRGVSVSSVVRDLVHEWRVDAEEQAAKTAKVPRPTSPRADVRSWYERYRSTLAIE